MSDAQDATPNASGKKPTQKKISIELPGELEADYANLAFITHTPAEIIIDFAQYLPRMPKGKVMSRIIMSPMHAKMLQMALAQNISNYERQFGEIRLPQRPNLADELFRYRPNQDDDDDDGKDEE
ncbi:MAG TPA: DUF3467 domain-containing protein [Candidatus Binatia bacterium]|jgi:hypothetical protein|nr:DUF3467 domain-containing protein [Candidatus Binatia bacterium]